LTGVKARGGVGGGKFQFEGHQRRSLGLSRSLFSALFISSVCVTNARTAAGRGRIIFKELVEIINCDKISLPFCNTLKEQFNLMSRLALDSLYEQGKSREYANDDAATATEK
jgi:hypothetical protein